METTRATQLRRVTDAILSGRCVAFVGAGFPGPVVPSWGTLLLRIARDCPDSLIRSAVEERLTQSKADSPPSALEFEGIGQLLRDTFELATDWESAVQRALAPPTTPAGNEQPRAVDPVAKATTTTRDAAAILAERVQLLREIPFRAILTTNFDPSLPGVKPDPKLYASILRDEHPWWPTRSEEDRSLPKAPIVKLHGDADGVTENPVVLHRSMYRDRLYLDHRYANFVRSVFATHSVVFLGVSFTDAYLNELRSEVLGFVDRGEHGPPWGYAVVANPSPTWSIFLRRYEGIETLAYDTAAKPNHEGFDDWLRDIHSATSQSGRLRKYLASDASSSVVWVDGNGDDHNFIGHEALKSVGADVLDVRRAQEVDDRTLLGADLILTNWGPDGQVFYEVMERVRHHANRPPVVVFAGDREASKRRFEAIRSGAWEYASTWKELFAVIERLFTRR